MPLIKSTLEINLRQIMDQDYSGFAGFPTTSTEVASRWADAIHEYAALTIPPSTTTDLAKSSFQSIMLSVTNMSDGLTLLQSALMSYATNLATGMSPAFTSTPPPILPAIATVTPIGLGGGSSEDCALHLATIIDTWFRTGIAVNSSSGATITWG